MSAVAPKERRLDWLKVLQSDGYITIARFLLCEYKLSLVRRKFRPRYFPLIVLIAFAANAIMPFFAVYNLPAAHAKAKPLSSVFGEQMLICTSTGFKWVTLADLQSGKEKPEPHPDYKCPLCYVASHGLKAPAVASVVIAYDYGRIYPSIFEYDPPLISLRLASPLNVRAPPVSFFG